MGQRGERKHCTTWHNAPSAQRRPTSRHTHAHLITFSQVLLSSVAINRVCGRALANSFIESLVVTHKDAHTRSHGSDALPDSYTQEELRGCQGDPFPCQTLILCQRYLSIHICSHLLSPSISLHFSGFNVSFTSIQPCFAVYSFLVLVLYIFITHNASNSLSCVHQLLSHSFN